MDKGDGWWPLWRRTYRKVKRATYSQIQRVQKVAKEWKASIGGWIGSAWHKRLRKTGANHRGRPPALEATLRAN